MRQAWPIRPAGPSTVLPAAEELGSVRVVLPSRSWMSIHTLRVTPVASPVEDVSAMPSAELQMYWPTVLVLFDPMEGLGRRMLFHIVPATGAAAE